MRTSQARAPRSEPRAQGVKARRLADQGKTLARKGLRLARKCLTYHLFRHLAENGVFYSGRGAAAVRGLLFTGETGFHLGAQFIQARARADGDEQAVEVEAEN